MKKILILLAICVLIIAGSYCFVKNYQNKAKIAEHAFKDIPEIVSVADQKLLNDGVIIENRVLISTVSLSWPGFVAVYENPKDKFGTLMGTSRFLTAGEYKNVPVDLTKSYPAGTKLFAVLHYDNGDGIFNLVQDFPIKNGQDKKEVVATFIIKE